ncbi:AraC-like ligand-binding domain-containing protein [Saccharopolyspora sp. 5N708]|uniref:AraC-like ligand-binding domain-containing protein n=1 Tax=Saccharopolyspora sp. 5N708 TaxID=3457424 RepID=UPI003FCFB01C
MIEAEFRTDDVAALDRFDMWRELLAKAMAPMDMGTDQPEQFRAEMRLLRFGAVSVWPATCQPMTFQRTSKLIRQSDPEIYHLSFPFRGNLWISQSGREDVHGPWDMYVVGTSQPFECANTSAKLVSLEVPRRLLPLSGDRVDRLVTHRLSAREGPGALLAGTLMQLARDYRSFRATDGVRLETVLVDLLAATLAHHLDAEDSLPPETRSRTLAARIRAFIRHHLQDPDLTPPMIAAAHHISVSYLHRIVRSCWHGTTLTEWIREQRLEHARQDLADEAQRATPVHHIAARWGYTNAAVFSRAFRAAFGAPPGEYRHQALNRARLDVNG